MQTLDRWEGRLARALATVINIVDPEVIVVGGGLSAIERLYDRVPGLWGQWIFSDAVTTRIVRAQHGADSGVRGAAGLWPVR
jgi:fructokinase